MTTILQVKCAWCGKDMGEKDGQGQEGVTHGICDDCLLHHFPNIYQTMYGDKGLTMQCQACPYYDRDKVTCSHPKAEGVPLELKPDSECEFGFEEKRKFVCPNCNVISDAVVEIRKDKPMKVPKFVLPVGHWPQLAFAIEYRRYIDDQWNRTLVCPVCDYAHQFYQGEAEE